MKILAIGAHADDVELGCGGSLAAWSAVGHEVVIHVVSESGYAAPDGTPVRRAEDAAAEAREAAALLGARLTIGAFKTLHLAFAEPLNAALVALVAAERPDLVLSHWPGDTHPDHQAVAAATLHACRRVPRLLQYQSNWYPGAQVFDGRFYVDITATFAVKQAAVAAHRSEVGRTGGAWLAQLEDRHREDGRVVGVGFAERFAVIKFLAPSP